VALSPRLAVFCSRRLPLVSQLLAGACVHTIFPACSPSFCLSLALSLSLLLSLSFFLAFSLWFTVVLAHGRAISRDLYRSFFSSLRSFSLSHARSLRLSIDFFRILFPLLNLGLSLAFTHSLLLSRFLVLLLSPSLALLLTPFLSRLSLNFSFSFSISFSPTLFQATVASRDIETTEMTQPACY